MKIECANHKFLLDTAAHNKWCRQGHTFGGGAKQSGTMEKGGKNGVAHASNYGIRGV